VGPNIRKALAVPLHLFMRRVEQLRGEVEEAKKVIKIEDYHAENREVGRDRGHHARRIEGTDAWR